MDVVVWPEQPMGLAAIRGVNLAAFPEAAVANRDFGLSEESRTGSSQRV